MEIKKIRLSLAVFWAILGLGILMGVGVEKVAQSANTGVLDANLTDLCYMRIQMRDIGVSIPVRSDQCSQLEYMCTVPEDVAWKILDCKPALARDRWNRTVCVCTRLSGYLKSETGEISIVT